MLPDFKTLRKTSHSPTGWKHLGQPHINLSWLLESMRGKCLLTAFQDVVGCMQIRPPKIPSLMLLLLKIWVYFLFPWIWLDLVTCFSCFNFCPCPNATEMTFWDFWAWDLGDNFLFLSEAGRGIKPPTTPRTTCSEAAKQGHGNVWEGEAKHPAVHQPMNARPQAAPGETSRKPTQRTQRILRSPNCFCFKPLNLVLLVVQSLTRP